MAGSYLHSAVPSSTLSYKLLLCPIHHYILLFVLSVGRCTQCIRKLYVRSAKYMSLILFLFFFVLNNNVYHRGNSSFPFSLRSTSPLNVLRSSSSLRHHKNQLKWHSLNACQLHLHILLFYYLNACSVPCRVAFIVCLVFLSRH